MKRLLFALLLVMMTISASHALPNLQLDIKNSVYDASTETVIATDDVFTLYALLLSNNSAGLVPAGQFYISAALTPKVAEQDNLNFGSFVFNGETINVTSDMVYGTPPIPDVEKHDLQDHGIFDTYFTQFNFSFNADPRFVSVNYNVQDSPGGLDKIKLADAGDSFLYYTAFNVDVGNLNDNYNIHFDLYTLNADGTIDKFAPFSHDAQSGNIPSPENPVPEPATMLLFGTGLLGIAGVMRKRKKVKQ